MRRRISWNHQFLKVPFPLLDGAVAGAIGVNTFLVYLMIRRFQWRTTHRDRRIHKLVLKDKLVAVVDQGRVAHLLGISRQTVCKACRQLTDLGWIRVVKLKDNHRAYVVGKKTWSQSEGRRGKDYFFADARVRQALKELPDEAATWADSGIVVRRKLLAKRLPELARMPASGRASDVAARDKASDGEKASVNRRDNRAVTPDDFPAVAATAKSNRGSRRERSNR